MINFASLEPWCLSIIFLSMIRRVSESYNIDLNSPEMNNNSCKKQNISLDVRFPSSLLMSLLEI